MRTDEHGQTQTDGLCGQCGVYYRAGGTHWYFVDKFGPFCERCAKQGIRTASNFLSVPYPPSTHH